jgi:hypothetical protein
MGRASAGHLIACGAAAALIVGALAACTGTSGLSGTAPSPHPTLTRALPSDLSPRGVLLAAVLLAEGDVETAVIDGLVTPAEVDEAIRAIERDELDLWVQRAEATLEE